MSMCVQGLVMWNEPRKRQLPYARGAIHRMQ